MLIKLVEQKNDELKNLKEIEKEHKELNGKLQKELNEENLRCAKYAVENNDLKEQNKDLEKSVDQIYDDYQDIGKMHFDYLENHKCRHCDADESFYCEECYQELVSENMKLQVELNEKRKMESNLICMNRYFGKELDDKDKIIKTMASFIEVNELDDKISVDYCPGSSDDCKYEDVDGCLQCIIEYFEKKVKENEIQKAQTEEM